MRIIQFIPTLNYAGAETMCKSLSLELFKLGHDVEIICEYDCNNSMVDELLKCVKIHFLHKKPGFDLSVVSKAKKIIRNFSPDIIHTHLDSLKYAFLSSRKNNVSIIHTIHNIAQYESRGISKWFSNRLFKKFKAIPVALSPEIQKTVCSYYNLKLSQVYCVHNGVQIDKIKQKMSYNSKGELKIVNIARFSKVKNQDLLIKAISEIHKQHDCVSLTLVGEGIEIDNCKKLVRELKAEKYIRFLGVRTDVLDILCDYDIFVLCSKYEGMPMSIVEAMAAGLAVVASNVGSIPEIIDDKKNGLLCEPTLDDVRDTIMKLIDDRGLIKLIGSNAVKKANMFSAKNMATNYLKIYDEQLHNKTKQ